jgi:hypothetical protein
MRRSTAQLLATGVGVLLLLGMLAAAIRLYPLTLWYHAHARARWEQQHLTHYEVTVYWASEMSFGHVRAEVRDNRVIGGTDLDTGRPLDAEAMVRASYFVSIDSMFRMINEQMRPASSWRYQLARYHPLLARWLDPCAALLPQVTYNTTLGYPTSIRYRGTPCFNGGNIYLTIEQLRPLP